MMLRRLAVIAVLALFALAERAHGQARPTPPSDSSTIVRLKDGSVVIGRVTQQTADSITVTTASGHMTLARSAITELKVISPADVHGDDYWAPDPHASRLFFGPTGRTLDQGTGYASDLYIFLANAAWGLTDRLTIGAGMSLFPSNDFLGNNVYYLTPKVGLVRGESFNLAVGALIGFAGHTNGSAGIYYVAATSGRTDASVTYGVGYAYFNNKVTGDATLMLGGNLRLSHHVALMSENYLFTGAGGGYWLPMYGVRLMGDRLSTDLGFVNFIGPGSSGIFPGVPWAGFAIRF